MAPRGIRQRSVHRRVNFATAATDAVLNSKNSCPFTLGYVTVLLPLLGDQAYNSQLTKSDDFISSKMPDVVVRNCNDKIQRTSYTSN